MIRFRLLAITNTDTALRVGGGVQDLDLPSVAG
jgi:hypothetical protein